MIIREDVILTLPANIDALAKKIAYINSTFEAAMPGWISMFFNICHSKNERLEMRPSLVWSIWAHGRYATVESLKLDFTSEGLFIHSNSVYSVEESYAAIDAFIAAVNQATPENYLEVQLD